MGKRTNLVVANQSDSLRTTVPGHIIEQFGLAKGDQLEWILKVGDGIMTIEIKPVKKV